MSTIAEERARISAALMAGLQRAEIDIELTLRILANWNSGAYAHYQPLQVSSLPQIDNRTIIDRRGPQTLELQDQDAARAIERLGRLLPAPILQAQLAARSIQPRSDARSRAHSGLRFDEPALRQLGILLYPRLAYGVLNGGSATSYADHKKNRVLDPALFGQLQPAFEELAALCHGQPKGVTPALLQPDGSPGPSFLELKMRSLLIEGLRWRRTIETLGSEDASGAASMDASGGAADTLLPLFPMFEMSSLGNRAALAAAYERFGSSPALRDLSAYSGIDIQHVIGAAQPLLAAYSHSDEGRRKHIFDRAGGRPDTPLGLPGGHGQNFLVLRAIYRTLYEMGKRYVYLGNVDNMGYTVDPVGLAWLALTGRPAAFEFSFRTPVDVKGGILVRDQRGALACGDIGVAIDADELQRAEGAEQAVLFNCAIGLFDLEWLTSRLDTIIAELPVRFSDQDKDAGRYSQAEQVTWEILGMIDDCLIFGVEKERRFLAAKLLLETLLTSGATPDILPEGATQQTARLMATGQRLHGGLVTLLGQAYGYRYATGHDAGRWTELSASAFSENFE